MGYLGRVKPLESIGNVVRSTYTGDASTTTYNLPVAVANEESIIVTINGVTQQDAAYSTNGTQLIFASAPALNDSIEIRCISGVGQGYTPPDGSVTTAKLNSQAVTADKLHNTLDLSGKTVTLPAGTGGKILQVVSTTKTDTFSSSSNSWTDITGLSVSITPSSTSSKVLVMYSIVTSANTSQFPILRILRGSTDIASGDSYASSQSGTTSAWAGGGINHTHVQSTQYLDSPSTTSTTTYKAQIIATESQAHYINRNTRDNGNYYEPRTISSITVMEIAG